MSGSTFKDFGETSTSSVESLGRVVQGSKIHSFRNPISAIRNSAGFAYIALLVAIIIIGISLGAAGKYWRNVMLREREEELIFRGEQYRKAIDAYYSYGKAFPPSIDDLLKDPRSAAGRRHLRQQYKDPITGEDFEAIKDPGTRRIIGVRSTSDKEPLKQANFPPLVLVPISAGTYSIKVVLPPRAPKSIDEDNTVSDKTKYNDWLFYTSILQMPQTNIPGQIPGQISGQIPGQIRR
jgi:type II secretory pathway pseudopilin PulG